jgi:hypothetical protein
MVWVKILVVTPLVLVMGVLLLSFLVLQSVFAGEGRGTAAPRREPADFREALRISRCPASPHSCHGPSSDRA